MRLLDILNGIKFYTINNIIIIYNGKDGDRMQTFSTKIYPTKNQKRYFKKCFGLRRWYWNWALETYIKTLNDTGEYLSNYSLAKIMNNEVLNKDEYTWAKQCNGTIRKQVFAELHLSWKMYYKKQKEARFTIEKVNSEYYKPQFKSKKNSNQSFTMQKTGDKTFSRINKKYIEIPMYGKRRWAKPMSLKLAENINWLKDSNIDIKLVTIKEYPIDTFTIFITYERTNHNVNKPNEDTKIGIDMGMKTPLTCYDGENTYKLNPLDRIKKAEEVREKYNKKLSRKLDSYKKQQKSKTYSKGFKFKESKRYLKIKQHLQKAYQREENIKKDFREKTTTWLVQNYHIINIEPFNNGFKKSNRAVARISQYLFYERLKQKSELHGTIINWISWEPTTQTCSSCGHRFINNEKLTLNNRKYICPNCNLTLDRDINSAINIYNLK